MPETVRVFGAARLHDDAERAEADAALAGFALSMAEQAAAGRRTPQEPAAARWLEAEDATIQQALTWALDHAPAAALRLAVAVAEWWELRGRGQAAREVLLAAVSHTASGSQAWCLAQFWLGDIGPPAASIGHETAAWEVLSAQPSTPLLAELLAGRSRTQTYFGRIPEAVSDARRALEVARQVGYQHRPVAPGPDQGQDQLPPPRRPDPAGPAGRPGLTLRIHARVRASRRPDSARCSTSPTARQSSWSPVGSVTPPREAGSAPSGAEEE